MSVEQMIRAVLWAATSTVAVVGSFIWAQVDGVDATTVILGATGLVSLVGLLLKLLADYRATSQLIDQYQESIAEQRETIRDERAENQMLRDQIRQSRRDFPLEP